MSWANAAYPKPDERDLIARDAETQEVEDTSAQGRKFQKVLIKTEGRVISVFPSVARSLAQIFEGYPEAKTLGIEWRIATNGRDVLPYIITKTK